MYFTVKSLLWQASEVPHHGIVVRCLTPGCEITLFSASMDDLLGGCSLHAFLHGR
jgi:hypothetical protein